MADDTAMVIVPATGQAIVGAVEDRLSRLARAVHGWLDENSTSPRTRHAYEGELKGFVAYLASYGLDLDSPASEVAQALQLWVKRAGKRAKGEAAPAAPAAASIAQRRACIASFYAYACRHSLLTANPALLMGKVRGMQQYRSAQPIKSIQLRKLLAAIDRTSPAGKRDYALLAIGLQTGRRLSELAACQWGDVYIDGDGVTVMWPRCKGGKSTRDELPAATARVLLAWRLASLDAGLSLDATAPVWVSLAPNNYGGRLSLQSIANICQKHLHTSKVHTLRHSFAAAMIEAGAAPTDVQARLLHSSLATTSRYLQSLASAHNPHADALAALAGIGD